MAIAKTKGGRVEVRNVLICRPGGDALQSIDPGAVSGIVEEGEGKEGGVDRVYAEVPNDLECNDARQSPVQADGHRLRRTGSL
ncbi:MAG: hypothetical protein IPJ47_02025 [Anaerolineales bacterium]|nr:hypothetical protein [Anaerolineales bacterium]